MMKTTILALAMVLIVLFNLTASAGRKNIIPKAKKTYVLVHGAWLAPYVWDDVSWKLKATGAEVIEVMLDGHGTDQTLPETITLDSYKNWVLEVIKKTKGKVILVGHSFAGIIISAVAEAIPDKIEKLIYIGAYVPKDGQTVLDLANTDTQSHLGPNLIPSADKLTLDVKHENIIDIFCADAKPETQQIVLSNFKPEPAIPFTNPVKLTEANFGRVIKYYVHTNQDHVIGIDLQNRMVAAAHITNIYSLDSSHTPFLSMPDRVADVILTISQQR